MKNFQQHQEQTQDRFAVIDERWSRVEDAIRIQTQERNQDINDLGQQLKQHGQQTQNIENQKTKIMAKTLNRLEDDSSEIKQNLDIFFDKEASFRVAHLDKKNDFIQNYTQAGNNFNTRLQQYSTNRIGDISARLEATDVANKQKTEQTLKELKEETIAEARAMFEKDQLKYTKVLEKIGEDSAKEMDKLKTMLKVCQKQRHEGEIKLKNMIETLVCQLEHSCEVEVKDGEVTYDCLLKLLEESCDRIQEAQLR